jgi:hypothetical protein
VSCTRGKHGVRGFLRKATRSVKFAWDEGVEPSLDLTARHVGVTVVGYIVDAEPDGEY